MREADHSEYTAKSPSGFGLFSRILGSSYTGVKCSLAGFELLGNKPKSIPFKNLQCLPEIRIFFGYSLITFTDKASRKYNVVGIKAADAEKILSDAKFFPRLKDYIIEQYTDNQNEFEIINKFIDSFEAPKNYPSACLIQPFLERIENAMDLFPLTIPKNVLPAPYEERINKIGFFINSLEMRHEKAMIAFVERELDDMKPFFDEVATYPLTNEQRIAVVTDEDATLVLAGAGSGKTSVIVAKAAYLIQKRIRNADEILLMAFGRDAATEMAERIQDYSGASIDAMTFHALGNKIIREVDGKGAPLAQHASDDAKLQNILRDILLNDLIKSSETKDLIVNWFSSLLYPYKSRWDFKNEREYLKWVTENELRTIKGDKVKSLEELEIANWLHLNGIDYEYEPVYEHGISSNTRGCNPPKFRRGLQ